MSGNMSVAVLLVWSFFRKMRAWILDLVYGKLSKVTEWKNLHDPCRGLG